MQTKTTLKILWFIILSGVLFIANHFIESPEINKEDSPKILINEQTIAQEDQDLSYQEYLKKGDEFFSKSDFPNAIAYYLQAYEPNSQSRDILNRLGEAYLKNNQASEAKSFFEASDNPIGRARAHLNLREVESAKQILNQSEQPSAETEYYKGVIAIIEGKPDLAEEIFNSIKTEEDSILSEKISRFLYAFETSSYYREAGSLFENVLLAQALSLNSEYESAIPILFKVIDEKNNYRDAWIVLGYSYLNAGKIPDAIDAFKQAEALDAQNTQTLFFLGLAYFANSDIDQAISYLEAADSAGYEPKDQINLKLGDLYLLQENYRKAATKYEKVLAQNPSNIEIFVRAIWINIDKINQVDNAIKLAQKALQSHPENPMSYNLAGWAYIGKEDYSRAEHYLSKAMEIDPTFDAANLNFGLLYEKQGMTILAKEYYKKAHQNGQGNSIANLAAQRFNRLTEQELQQYYQTNISSP